MGAAAVAIGIGGLGANSAVHAARAGSGMALAAAGAINQGANAYKNTKGSKGKKVWAAAKTIAISGAAFAAAVWAGKELNGIATEAFAETPNPTPPTPVADSLNTEAVAQPQITEPTTAEFVPEHVLAPEAEQAQPQVTDWGKTISEGLSGGIEQPQAPNGPEIPLRDEGNSETVAPAQSENTSTDNTAPAPAEAIDVNNLTNEQAHDIKMLFLRDPREANAILDQKGNDWMNSRQLQEAWDKGDITPEQKAELVKFAGERFDERGNFVGQDAEKMEAAAKAYSAARSAQNDSVADTPAPVAENAASGAENAAENIQPTKEQTAEQGSMASAEAAAQNAAAKNAEPAQKPDFEIKKIKINSDGTAKIVGTENGQRTVVTTDASNLDESLQRYDKVKFHKNGDISISETHGNNKVSYTVTDDNKVINASVNGNPVETSAPEGRNEQLVSGKEATESTVDKLKNLSGRGTAAQQHAPADKPAPVKITTNTNTAINANNTGRS